jgi:hypothetical protein
MTAITATSNCQMMPTKFYLQDWDGGVSANPKDLAGDPQQARQFVKSAKKTALICRNQCCALGWR